MKILQILPSLEAGGVERGVIDLTKALRKRNIESVVISSGGPLVAELQKIGVPHYELPVHKKSPFSLFLIPTIVRIIEKEGMDIIHARSRVPGWLAWFAARRTGKPFVTTCHGYYSLHFLSRIMGWGKRVIVISRVIGRHMIDDFGVPADRIRLIHRGVDLTQFTYSPSQPRRLPENVSLRATEALVSFPRKRESIVENGSPLKTCGDDKKHQIDGRKGGARPFRVINVGRLSPIKGQIEFLKACAILRRTLPALEVLLVGSEGKGKHKYTARIKETIEQLGLQSCVKLLGLRTDISQLIASSDLLVLSTLVPEAFGRVLIEAGAVGTPVVATQTGGILDVIDSGENGLLIPPYDIEGMAGAMRQIVENPEKASQLAKNLREKVEKNFTLDRMVEETLKVYEEVRQERKILILKLGAVGDLILNVPSFRMIRERFPEARIYLLTDRKIARLVSNSPYIDELIGIRRDELIKLPYLLKLAKKLRAEGFDKSVDFQNTKWTHLLAFLSAIPERYGFVRGSLGFLLNRGDYHFKKQDAPVRHQFRILSRLGIREFGDALELWPEEASEKKAEEWLATGDSASEKRVGFVIGSSPEWPTKRWPMENFYELAKRLQSSFKCQIIWLGSESDRVVLGDGHLHQANPSMDLLGKTSLMDLVSVIKRLDLLVTGDTAPLHVASAMQIKTIAFFGPTDPKRHVPPGAAIKVFSKSLPCQPCYSGICKNQETLACLQKISVDEVFEIAKKMIEGGMPSSSVMSSPRKRGSKDLDSRLKSCGNDTNEQVLTS